MKMTENDWTISPILLRMTGRQRHELDRDLGHADGGHCHVVPDRTDRQPLARVHPGQVRESILLAISLRRF